jgi:DUF4097 and DUF4098 domain-containing protein YvlB
MSKTTKIVLIFSSILLVCIIGIGIIFGVYYGNENVTDGFKNLFGKGIEVNESQMLDLEGISMLHINCVSGDIDVIESDEAKITLAGNVWSTEDLDDFLKVTMDDDTVIASFDTKTKPFGIFNADVVMTVYLPSEYILDVDIESASGDISINSLEFEDLNIDSTSGDTEIMNCKGDTMAIDKSSGDTKVAYADFESIRINSTSGDVNVNDTPANITLISISGDSNFDKVSGSLDIKSTSGRVEASVDGASPEPITIDSISGSVKLYLDSDAAFDISAKVVSGDIDSDFDITFNGMDQDLRKSIRGTVNGGGSQVDITTTSGGIDLIEK